MKWSAVRIFLVAAAWLMLAAPAHAGSEPFLLNAAGSGAYVNAYVDYFIDATEQMTVEQIAREPNFTATGGKMGINAHEHPLWLRITLQRSADVPSQWRLEYGSAAERIRFFAPDGKGGFITQASGDSLPFITRPFPYSRYLYTLNLTDTRPVTFYVQTSEIGGLQVFPMRIWQFDHWAVQSMTQYLVYGLCFGIMVGLALYNLLLFARLRDGIFLLYFVLILSHILFALNLSGVGTQMLWPAWFNTLPGRGPLLSSLWAICAILFAKTLFDGPDINRWVGRVLYAIVGAAVLAILAILNGLVTPAEPVIQGLPMVWIPLVMGLAGYRAWRQSLPAVYYLIGYGPVLLSIGLLLVAFRNFVPATPLVMSFFLGAGAWEAVLFSQALAERVNLLKRQREAAERHSREADAELAMIEHKRAYTDELTGLANRERLRQEGDAWLVRNIEPLVLALNIDRFKAINDTLGYTVGDAVLVETGHRLAALPDTAVGRLHSNQFCVICRQTERLDELRQRIMAAFAEPLSVDDRSVDVTLSAGIVASAAPGTNMATRLRNAEIALHAGRRNFTAWSHYASDMESAHRTDLALLSALRRAVDNDELRLYLQPKVRLSDGCVNSAEALVRWQHPERGLVPPAEFIPFAEQSGCIRYLTRWILHEAMRITRTWRESGNALQISVNLSMHDLRDPVFAEEMRELLEISGANPGDIRLEITEGVVMDDPTVTLKVMRTLKEQGFSLSVDDFGTGYSSLAYLQKMPVTELKIDRAFVSGTRVGGDAEALLDSIIALGHRLGLSVVAEGAETVEEWNLLRALGCDYVQGWIVAKAMPIAELERWVSHNTPFRLPMRVH